MNDLRDLTVRRHGVTETGRTGGRAMVFAHGYATNQGVWRHVAPAFEEDFHVVRFDHLGAGSADPSGWDATRHATLDGYADDVVALLRALELQDVVYVGHSVGGVIGALAATRAPELFDRLIMVGPSARFLDDAGYVGGFSSRQMGELIEQLDDDFGSWARTMAPVLVGADASSQVSAELQELLLAAPSETRTAIARTVLLADHREDMARVPVRALVMQASSDPLVPVEVGRFIERQLPDGHFVQLAATGHFPNLSAPDEVIAAIRAFV